MFRPPLLHEMETFKEETVEKSYNQRGCRNKRRTKETNIAENGLYWKFNRYKPFDFCLELRLNYLCFFLAVFSDLALRYAGHRKKTASSSYCDSPFV
ncbi:MAG: hypothetical protein SPJ42_02120, partial [Oscillospiraceae bacterium]|nr:hypothetical protein [Oscillospiraceae bacterium]